MMHYLALQLQAGKRGKRKTAGAWASSFLLPFAFPEPGAEK
jgi:hypothetical protein